MAKMAVRMNWRSGFTMKPQADGEAQESQGEDDKIIPERDAAPDGVARSDQVLEERLASEEYEEEAARTSPKSAR